MGTKNNPGQFDCYTNAEPMFILRGRDRHAAGLVRLWAILRAQLDEDPAQVEEALACARAMDEFILAKKGLRVLDTGAPFERLLEAATKGLAEHPESFDHSCECDLCLSYAC